MKELLEKWHALEPKRASGPSEFGSYLVRFSTGRVNVFDSEESAFGRALALVKVQAAVQEAAGDHGMDWAVTSPHRGGRTMTPRFRASVGASEAGGRTPAEALLTAYLAALEANS